MNMYLWGSFHSQAPFPSLSPFLSGFQFSIQVAKSIFISNIFLFFFRVESVSVYLSCYTIKNALNYNLETVELYFSRFCRLESQDLITNRFGTRGQLFDGWHFLCTFITWKQAGFPQSFAEKSKGLIYVDRLHDQIISHKIYHSILLFRGLDFNTWMGLLTFLMQSLT